MSKEEKIILTIPAELTWGPHKNKGKAFLKFDDTSVAVRDGKNGPEIGRVSGVIGGGVELVDTQKGVRYWLSPEDLWEAFQKALNDLEV